MHRLGWLSVLVMISSLLGAVPAAQGADPTCRGLPVTIVGTPGSVTAGTPGDDVILVPFDTDETFVGAGAGDDVVCVVPGPPDPPGAEFTGLDVDAGAGNDVIDTTALPVGHHGVHSWLGAGNDTYEGGPAPDIVFGGSYGDTYDDPTFQATEQDVIATGANADQVYSGSQAQLNPDDIDLGDGDDEISFAGLGQGPGGSLSVGAGANRLRVSIATYAYRARAAAPTDPLVMDAAASTSTLGGQPYLSWTGGGFVDYDFQMVSNPLTFHGTDRSEHIVLGQSSVDVDMVGGNDRVDHPPGLFPSGFVDGGDGRDGIRVYGRGDVWVALGFGAEVEGFGALDLARFEIAKASGGSVEVYGTAGPNKLTVVARKHVRLRGRAGDDTLVVFATNRPGGGTRLVDGGRGDDVITGSQRDDTLIGGSGRDSTYGQHGIDVCQAEIRRGCESSTR